MRMPRLFIKLRSQGRISSTRRLKIEVSKLHFSVSEKRGTMIVQIFDRCPVCGQMHYMPSTQSFDPNEMGCYLIDDIELTPITPDERPHLKLVKS